MFLSEVEIERFVSLNHCSLEVFFWVEAINELMNQFDMNTKVSNVIQEIFQKLFFQEQPWANWYVIAVHHVFGAFDAWSFWSTVKTSQKIMDRFGDTNSSPKSHWIQCGHENLKFYDEALEMRKFHIELFEGMVNYLELPWSHGYREEVILWYTLENITAGSWKYPFGKGEASRNHQFLGFRVPCWVFVGVNHVVFWLRCL